MKEGQPVSSKLLRHRTEATGVKWQYMTQEMRHLGMSYRNGPVWEWCKPMPGTIELELRKVCNFKINSESRQEELERIIDTMIALSDRAPVSISQQAAGWLTAAINEYNDGWSISEPDKYKQKWLSPMLQHVLGTATLIHFMEMELVESEQERELFRVIHTTG
jgi:hypothetical protein